MTRRAEQPRSQHWRQSYRCLAVTLSFAACVVGCGIPISTVDGDADSSAPTEAGPTDAHDARVDAPVLADAWDGATDAPTDSPSVRDAGSDAAPDAPPSEPDFDTLPWIPVGFGVGYRDSRNPAGENVFIGYAGYGVSADQSRTWVTRLFHAWLHDRGVRYVYAVQGPATVGYDAREIQNTRLIATMLPTLTPATHFIAIGAHSSGGWVACELMQQLFAGGLDPTMLTRGRTVFYDMEGVQSCVDATMVSNLRRAYFMSAHTNAAPGGWAINAMFMMQGAARLGSGGFRAYDASSSGCQPSAGMCLHSSLINTHPNDPTTGTPRDYADYARGAVNTWFLESTAVDLPR